MREFSFVVKCIFTCSRSTLSYKNGKDVVYGHNLTEMKAPPDLFCSVVLVLRSGVPVVTEFLSFPTW